MRNHNYIYWTYPPLAKTERFDTWVHISLQGVSLDVLLVIRNVLFIEPTKLFWGKIGRFVSEEVLIQLVRCNACLFCYMVLNVSFCQNPMLTL